LFIICIACTGLTFAFFLCRVELAEIEPSTRGTKRGACQRIFAEELRKDVDIAYDDVAEDEVASDTMQHGEGLTKSNREIFSVQHKGSYGIAF
jgi:hypothetical protein